MAYLAAIPAEIAPPAPGEVVAALSACVADILAVVFLVLRVHPVVQREEF